MRVFVTGHKGYIGAHLVDILKQAGHHVTGCDIGLYEGCEWDQCVMPDVDLVKDVRAITAKDLETHDCVMHLAAISNDPMGDINPEITHSINRDASIRIAQLAKTAGVGRYLFSGSCSVYGQGEKLDLEETDPLNPLTAYAKSKIDTELEVSKLADDGFTPSFLRNATAYGYSPMLRIDLVVNSLLGSAIAFNQIRIQSDGSPWRPLIHCKDIANAFYAFLHAPKEVIHNQAINIGGNSENYQVKDVADYVEHLMPNADIVFTGEVGHDPRNYRVKFDKLNDVLPEFKLEYDLKLGMDELHKAMIDHGFNEHDFNGSQFVRLRTLQKRLNKLDAFQIR
ncbi:UDP-glucose 4-epimerase [Poriferisphaera corsica]|uniref:UDP-glucose 4-epimerase n=1 Tax=Poriferisphaera corsica TaxID=2528020 RepID=A0A517YWD8_9BACT|nr:SDR family oxidoreductase [Poriferisphaera corsica]QDU34543.1 UDP-glucose 4-epimerase [Poriferisphaera corsica]